MTARRLTVLGGGNTAFSLAANLSLRGFGVTLYELPAYASTLAPLGEGGAIRLSGVAEQGVATVARLTSDAAVAAEADLLLLAVPSYAHRAFAAALIPHLRPGHTLLLTPGNLGSLAFARAAREAGRDSGVTFAEADTAPYVCRKLAPDHAHIWGVVGALGVGVFPARATPVAIGALTEVFPGLRPYPNALACGLNATNPTVHPAGVLLNAGRVEYARGDFYFYEEGVSPGVARAIEAVDGERRAVGAAFGLTLPSVAENYWQAGFGPRGDLWATINGSRMLTQLRAPGSLETRWLTEDIPYGIATWALLGEERGVSTPLLRGLTALGSAVVGRDLWSEARSPVDLGLAGLRLADIAAYLDDGTRPVDAGKVSP